MTGAAVVQIRGPGLNTGGPAGIVSPAAGVLLAVDAAAHVVVDDTYRLRG